MQSMGLGGKCSESRKNKRDEDTWEFGIFFINNSMINNNYFYFRYFGNYCPLDAV